MTHGYQNRFLYSTAILASLVLSYLGSAHAVVVNPDGICYLQGAMTISSEDLRSAMHVCGQMRWPFYSMIIASVVHITHASYVTAAFLCNGIFSLLSIVSFIYIASLLGGTRRVLWCAAAVILLAHQFNSVREYVIRDHGFWAFYLLSVAALLQYVKTWLKRYALMWAGSLIVATLFRLEGAVYLLLLPWAIWFCSTLSYKHRLFAFLQLNIITVVVGAGLLIWFVFTPHQIRETGRLIEIQNQLLHGLSALSQSFQAAALGLKQHVLSQYAVQDATLLLFLLLILWYGIYVVSNVSLIYMALILYAGWHKLIAFKNHQHVVIYSYIIISVVITASFLIENMFLTKRYLIALSLILMLWVPFALNKIIQDYSSHKWRFFAVVFCIFITAIGGIFDFGYSKNYIRQAGVWLEKNAPPNAAIYSNNQQVMYYSNHFGNEIFAQYPLYRDSVVLSDNKWQQFDFIALHLTKKERNNNPVLKEITVLPQQIFSNKRGDEVVIYQVKH